MVSDLRASLPTVTTTAAGTLALATPVMSSRRVMATSVLFLVSRLAFQLFSMRDVGSHPSNPGLRAALEPLRSNPCCAANGARDCTHQGGSSDFEFACR